MDLKHGISRKGDKEIIMGKIKKQQKQKKVYKEVEVKVKRPRGRPRKHPLVVVENVIKRPRGRPKKNGYVKVWDRSDPNVPLVPTKLGKILGYCPKCNGYVSSLDIMEDKKHCFCYSCNEEYKISKLLSNVANKNEIKHKSKREYLEDCLVVDNDSIPMRPHEPISKKELGAISSPTEE